MDGAVSLKSLLGQAVYRSFYIVMSCDPLGQAFKTGIDYSFAHVELIQHISYAPSKRLVYYILVLSARNFSISSIPVGTTAKNECWLMIL